jgi:hypothetical protein
MFLTVWVLRQDPSKSHLARRCVACLFADLLELIHECEVLREVLFAKFWEVKSNIALIEISARFESDPKRARN